MINLVNLLFHLGINALNLKHLNYAIISSWCPYKLIKLMMEQLRGQLIGKGTVSSCRRKRIYIFNFIGRYICPENIRFIAPIRESLHRTACGNCWFWICELTLLYESCVTTFFLLVAVYWTIDLKVFVHSHFDQNVCLEYIL